MEKLGMSERRVVSMLAEALARPVIGDWSEELGLYIPDAEPENILDWLGAAPAWREWVGGRNAVGLLKQRFTILLKKWEATIELSADDIRNDRQGRIQLRIDEMAQGGSQHWREVISELALNGASGVCYDGKYFFAANHALGDSGTQINLLTASQVAALDVVTAAAPTQAEMAAAILGVVAYMCSWKDDKGKYANENAQKFAVMVPTNLWGAANSACSEKILLGASGAPSPSPITGSRFSISAIHNPRFTSTTAFHVYRTDGVRRAYAKLERGQPRISYLGEGSDIAFTQNKHLAGVEADRAAGYAEWQCAAHATLS